MKYRKSFTIEEENQIIKLYTVNNLSIKDIRLFLHSSDDKVKDIIVKHNIPLKRNFIRIPKEIETEICKLYETMDTIEIARKFDIKDYNVLHILEKYNIPRKTTNIHSFNKQYFNKIDTKDKAYFLGLLFADGNVCKNKYTTSINLNKRDTHILEEFSKHIGFVQPLYIKPSNPDVVFLKLNSIELSNDLINLGCVPNKSLILDWPIKLPKHLISHFVRGYFDGDGCISSYLRKNENRATYALNIVSSTIFIKKLNKIIKKYTGLVFKMRKSKNPKTSLLYCAKYSSVIKFFEWIYKDCGDLKINRKFERYNLMKLNKGINFKKYKE